MLSDQNAFQSYIHMHVDHLCAIVLHGVLHEILILTVAIFSVCVYVRAAVEIRSMLDEMTV